MFLCKNNSFIFHALHCIEFFVFANKNILKISSSGELPNFLQKKIPDFIAKKGKNQQNGDFKLYAQTQTHREKKMHK